MIKLLGLLFTITLLYGKESVYLFPDQHSYCVYQLNKAMKNASERIIVISHSFNHPELKKGILQAAKHGKNVTLVLNDLHRDALSMVQYDHIELYSTPHPFDTSTLIIDHSLVCTFPGAIEEEDFSFIRSSIRCSDNPKTIEQIRRSLNPLISSAKLYLE
ncbi:hypothetical protein [Sulfuricurvum sp.]|uniref:hypothetical protein n=1 Tax=Sulfuricurvum sp. TaxID=2025608 RepID=UPI002D454DA8|nr:hypothetical protein [Sulfuricurvum sp.]HZF69270.1 hypothetical protein [Sulfuricurvum sp.]